jgi:hypothetical protein
MSRVQRWRAARWLRGKPQPGEMQRDRHSRFDAFYRGIAESMAHGFHWL